MVTKGLQCACPAVTYLTCLTISNDGETSRCTNANAVPKALQLGALLDDHHAAALSWEQLRLLLIWCRCLLADVRGRLGEAAHVLNVALADLDRVRWVHPVMTLIHRIKLL